MIKFKCKNSESFLMAINDASYKEEKCLIKLEKGEYYFDDTIEIRIPPGSVITANNHLINDVIFNFINMPYVSYDRNNNNNGINVYSDNITIENITIKNSPFRGIENYGNENTFNNIEIYHCIDTGLSIRGGNNVIINCYSHHNCDYKFFKNGEHKAGFNSDGFSDKMHNSNGNIWINCCSEYNGDDGFDCFQRNSLEKSPTQFLYCTSMFNGLDYMDLSGYERLLQDNEWNNKYDIKHWPCNGNGNGFKFGGIRKESEINIHNVVCKYCNSSHNKKSGYTDNHNSGNIELSHCIAVNNIENNYKFYFENHNINISNSNSIPIKMNRIKNGKIKLENNNILSVGEKNNIKKDIH